MRAARSVIVRRHRLQRRATSATAVNIEPTEGLAIKKGVCNAGQ